MGVRGAGLAPRRGFGVRAYWLYVLTARWRAVRREKVLGASVSAASCGTRGLAGEWRVSDVREVLVRRAPKDALDACGAERRARRVAAANGGRVRPG